MADILEQISSCLRYSLSPNKIGRIMAGLEFESIRYKGKGLYSEKTGDIDRNGDPALWDCDFLLPARFFTVQLAHLT